MTNLSYEAIINAMEGLGWEVDFRVYDDAKELELSSYSNLGEYLVYTINGTTPKELAIEIMDIYANFDVGSHVEFWVEAKMEGVKGVPSVKELIEDATEIEKMLKELSETVREIVMPTETIGESVAAYKANQN